MGEHARPIFGNVFVKQDATALVSPAGQKTICLVAPNTDGRRMNWSTLETAVTPEGYGARFLPDATFTNVNRMFHCSRDGFNRRHEEIFAEP
jgi:hypothetical protein